MKQVDLHLIKEKSIKMTYKPPKSEWNKYLSTDKKYNPNELVEVKTLKRIYLVEENKRCIRNEKITITKSRASELETKGLIEW